MQREGGGEHPENWRSKIEEMDGRLMDKYGTGPSYTIPHSLLELVKSNWATPGLSDERNKGRREMAREILKFINGEWLPRDKVELP